MVPTAARHHCDGSRSILMIPSHPRALTDNQLYSQFVKIISIKRSRRSSGRIAVHLEEGDALVLPLEVVLTSGLKVGTELDDGRLNELRDASERWRCREAALRLITFRARSTKELRDRLLRKGFGPPQIETVVEELIRSGLLDDASFASAFAIDRVRQRPVARRRLVLELRARGIDEATARDAAERAYEEAGEDEVSLARRAARRFRRKRGEDDARAARRFYALLARRGFGREAIREVAGEFLE